MQCGGKYIVLFDYYDSNSNPLGSMKEEHFQALEVFWKDVIKNPDEIRGSIKADSVLVLPQNHGWGTRWMEDKVWGIFKADNQTRQIWDLIQLTMEKQGFNTDIIYADSEFALPIQYQKVYLYSV